MHTHTAHIIHTWQILSMNTYPINITCTHSLCTIHTSTTHITHYIHVPYKLHNRDTHYIHIICTLPNAQTQHSIAYTIQYIYSLHVHTSHNAHKWHTKSMPTLHITHTQTHTYNHTHTHNITLIYHTLNRHHKCITYTQTHSFPLHAQHSTTYLATLIEVCAYQDIYIQSCHVPWIKLWCSMNSQHNKNQMSDAHVFSGRK